MNKAQLIDSLSQRLNGDKRVAAEAVQHFVDIVVRTVEAGDHVTITGFGVFEKRARAARVARNPRTGETVRVAPTSVPAFRPGAQFKAVVSGEQELPEDAPAVKRASAGQGGAGRKRAATKKTDSAKKTGPKKSASTKDPTSSKAKKSDSKKNSKSKK